MVIWGLFASSLYHFNRLQSVDTLKRLLLKIGELFDYMFM